MRDRALFLAMTCALAACRGDNAEPQSQQMDASSSDTGTGDPSVSSASESGVDGSSSSSGDDTDSASTGDDAHSGQFAYVTTRERGGPMRQQRVRYRHDAPPELELLHPDDARDWTATAELGDGSLVLVSVSAEGTTVWAVPGDGDALGEPSEIAHAAGPDGLSALQPIPGATAIAYVDVGEANAYRVDFDDVDDPVTAIVATDVVLAAPVSPDGDVMLVQRSPVPGGGVAHWQRARLEAPGGVEAIAFAPSIGDTFAGYTADGSGVWLTTFDSAAIANGDDLYFAALHGDPLAPPVRVNDLVTDPAERLVPCYGDTVSAAAGAASYVVGNLATGESRRYLARIVDATPQPVELVASGQGESDFECHWAADGTWMTYGGGDASNATLELLMVAGGEAQGSETLVPWPLGDEPFRFVAGDADGILLLRRVEDSDFAELWRVPLTDGVPGEPQPLVEASGDGAPRRLGVEAGISPSSPPIAGAISYRGKYGDGEAVWLARTGAGVIEQISDEDPSAVVQPGSISPDGGFVTYVIWDEQTASGELRVRDRMLSGPSIHVAEGVLGERFATVP